MIGSQYRFFSTGCMCSCFLDLVTSLAAVYCTRCNFFMSTSGSPWRRQLRKSSCDETKAWMSHSHICWSMNWLISPIFRWWNQAPLQIEFTWFFKLSTLSMTMPMFLAWVVHLTTQSPIVIEISPVFDSNDFLPMNRTSVLSSWRHN